MRRIWRIRISFSFIEFTDWIPVRLKSTLYFRTAIFKFQSQNFWQRMMMWSTEFSFLNMLFFGLDGDKLLHHTSSDAQCQNFLTFPMNPSSCGAGREGDGRRLFRASPREPRPSM
jgi:hypothetical protein